MTVARNDLPVLFGPIRIVSGRNSTAACRSGPTLLISNRIVLSQVDEGGAGSRWGQNPVAHHR
jgi:hypothetical protein